ncbi:MAG: 1-acyl-sn-glycerol-3-phosphate acyltransferase [Kosmotoga sp.]|nr:MAG: 1-acyl-sn-glycerol-3-phosphate acyltransferase [Kosmotoga sp.]
MNKFTSLLVTIWVGISFFLYVCVYGSAVLLISLIIEKLSTREKAKDYLGKEVGRFGKAAFLLSFSKVSVFGKKNVPEKGPFVIVSNHQSAFDIPLMVGFVKGKISFIAKKEVEKIPFLKWFVLRLDGILIERGNKIQTASSMRKILRVLKCGGTIMLFPEGTRDSTGKMGDFKEGSLAIPYKLNIPILPVTLEGTRNMMKKGSLLIRPSKIDIRILEPLFPKNFTSEEELRKKSEELIGNALIAIKNDEGSDNDAQS